MQEGGFTRRHRDESLPLFEREPRLLLRFLTRWSESSPTPARTSWRVVLSWLGNELIPSLPEQRQKHTTFLCEDDRCTTPKPPRPPIGRASLSGAEPTRHALPVSGDSRKQRCRLHGGRSTGPHCQPAAQTPHTRAGSRFRCVAEGTPLDPLDLGSRRPCTVRPVSPTVRPLADAREPHYRLRAVAVASGEVYDFELQPETPGEIPLQIENLVSGAKLMGKIVVQ